jgi:hypothetical protein
MQYEERYNTDKLKFLSTLDQATYTKFIHKETAKKADIKANYETFKKFVGECIKNDGVIQPIYSQNKLRGRFYSRKPSVQQLSKYIRGFLCHDISTDIDIKNCYPVILKYICDKNEILCPDLTYYVEHRDVIFRKYNTVADDIKKQIFTIIFGGKFVPKNEFVIKFKKEFGIIQQKLSIIPEFQKYFENFESTKSNKEGASTFKIIEDIEIQVVSRAMKYLKSKNCEILAYMYDGCMIYGDHYNDAELINGLNVEVGEYFKDLKIEFLFKMQPQDTQIIEGYKIFLPEEYDEADIIQCDVEDGEFERASKDFEKTHAKIIERGEYVVEEYEDGKVKSFSLCTESKLVQMYKHLSYSTIEKGIDTKHSFITKWIGYTNSSIRSYKQIGCYPNTSLCPDGVYNSWNPFKMEFINEYEDKSEDLEFMLNHIYVLCGKEKEVYDYFLYWVAHSIQFPEQKCGVAPVFISAEGAGKGSFLGLLRKMLGHSKVMETTSPERDVWGQFNAQMVDSYVVNINEVSKKNLQDAYGRIKALITDNSLTINIKGLSQFEIISYHRFILTTNNEEPINTASGDRRFLVIRSSDDLVGDKTYFAKFNRLLESQDLVKHCYEYFKTMSGADGFIRMPLPETEHHRNLKELGKSKERLWLEWYVCKNSNVETIQATSRELFDSFKQYLDENGTEKYDITSLQLGVRLKNMKLKGIVKGAHTREGECKLFELKTLRKELRIFMFEEDKQQTIKFENRS